MSRNKKELILESFQKMDMNMLDVLLDEDKTYQSARKEIFLEKISDAFLTFKESGDTHLIMLPGYCKSKQCPNRGRRGYSFIGNNSKKNLDLIFEELDNDINDIFYCKNFATNDRSIDNSKPIIINIQDSETLENENNIDFLIEIRRHRLAYEELYRNKDIIIDKTIYLPWLRRYYKLYESTRSSYHNQEETRNFQTLYSNIYSMSEFLKHNDLAKKAFDEFQQVNQQDEKQLLEWLCKYEDHRVEMDDFWLSGYKYENPDETEYFKVKNVKIAISDYENVARFILIMKKHYMPMLEKYNTFSMEQFVEYCNAGRKMEYYVYSLTYHINERGGIDAVCSSSKKED